MSVPELFKSKRFWSAVIGLVVLIASSLEPRLADHLNVIAPSIVAIVGMLVGGFTIEETTQVYSDGKVDAAKAQNAK